MQSEMQKKDFILFWPSVQSGWERDCATGNENIKSGDGLLMVEAPDAASLGHEVGTDVERCLKQEELCREALPGEWDLRVISLLRRKVMVI